MDAVSSDHPITKCVSKDDASRAVYLHLLRESPELPKLKATFQNFLNTVRAAIGLGPAMIPDPIYSTPPPKHVESVALFER